MVSHMLTYLLRYVEICTCLGPCIAILTQKSYGRKGRVWNIIRTILFPVSGGCDDSYTPPLIALSDIMPAAHYDERSYKPLLMRYIFLTTIFVSVRVACTLLALAFLFLVWPLLKRFVLKKTAPSGTQSA